MSDARSGGGESASDLFDAWMAHRGQPDAPEEELDTPGAAAASPVGQSVAPPVASVAQPVARSVAPPAVQSVPVPPQVVPEAPAVEPLSARLRAFRGEPAAAVEAPVEAVVEVRVEPPVEATVEPAPVSVEDAGPAQAPEVRAEPVAPTPEPVWRGYVLPSITPADLVAMEPAPVASEPEPEPVAVEPQPVAVEPEPEPVAVQPEPVALEPEPEPEPEPVAAEPDPEPVAVAVEPEPELELVVAEPEPEPVAVEPDLEPEPEPVAVEPEPEPEPEPVAVAVEPAPGPTPPVEEPAARAGAPLGITAALAAAAARADEQAMLPPSAKPKPRREPTPPPVVRDRETVFAATSKPAAPTKADDVPAVTEFTPREGNRFVAGLLLLVALVAAVLAGYLAWYERSAATIGIGCTLFILVLVIWATRASSAPAHLKINSGHLTVQRTGTIRHFDLASKYTALEVHGRPGLPGWKVLIEQRDAAPYVIDSSMVNPRAFMRVLRYYRPEL